MSNHETELHDEMEIAEAQEMENPEEENTSADSVEKATKATKKAPARKGDKAQGDMEADKAESGIVEAMKKKMKMAEEEDEMEDEDDDEDDDDEDEMEEMKKGKKMMKKESYDFSEDLDAIIADEATLSEEFKSKTAVIFEAAVKSKLREEVDRLEEQYEQRLTEELEQMSTDLIEKVDGYLDYVVDEWMKENEVAIQNGIRNEIAEGFMSGLKDLFEENYVDVPDSKIDLVDELAEQNEQLNEKANASVEEVLSLREELNNYKRDAIIREATVGLADTQADKLAKLVEDVDFVDEETFIDKVITIRDSYFSKKTSNYQLDEEADQSELTEQASSPVMQSYLTALRKSAKQ